MHDFFTTGDFTWNMGYKGVKDHADDGLSKLFTLLEKDLRISLIGWIKIAFAGQSGPLYISLYTKLFII